MLKSSPVTTTVRYILLTALRDRLFLGMVLGVAAAAYISSIMGSTALVETQVTTLTYAAGVARLILAVGLIVFVCFHIKSAFDSKEIDVMLSRPIARDELVVAYWLGFAAVAVLLVLPVACILGYLSIIRSQQGLHLLQPLGLGIWCLSLLLESLLVVALALFSAFTLRSAVSAVMASLGFYVLSRMMGFFIATLQSGAIFQEQELNLIARYVLTAVSAVIPRLDFFAKTEWLAYSVRDVHDVRLFALQGVIFVPLLVLAAIADFKRKQF